MRDDVFRSVTERTVCESHPAATWPIELANALICYALLHPEYVVPERDLTAEGVRTPLVAWMQDTGCGMYPATRDALAATTKDDRDELARAVLHPYLDNRGIPHDTTPNLHGSHMNVLTEYIKGIYEISDQSMVRYRCFRPMHPFAPVGQVTVYGDGQDYVMQGIVVCPFFSAFQKTLFPESARIRVADTLVAHASRHGSIRPVVRPIDSNPVWKERLEALQDAGGVVVLDDDESSRSSSSEA
jgi:hypothetical protein